jgi:hypothetical protein
VAYRDLRTALETKRDALVGRKGELDRAVEKLSDAAQERQRVHEELHEVEAHLDEVKKRRLPMLSRLQVATPCNASWEDMRGDDRVRFCGKCEKNVYNLSELGEDEAEALVYEHEGNLCARFYRRKDGTLITSDCRVGKRRRRGIAFAALGLAATAAGGLYYGLFGEPAVTMGAIAVVPANTPAVMGSVAVPIPKR